MTELSILVPSRNEQFLGLTIKDALEHSEADTEIIAVLDGAWASPPIEDHPRVTLIYSPEVIGQRAATNMAARVARGKYVMKVDAHCSFAQGFDRIMIEDMAPDLTMVPVMKNLHAFDWVCQDGHRRYQGPSGPCKTCGKPTEMEMVWVGKDSPNSTSYCFDAEPHFQYFREYAKRDKRRQTLTETMSLQGSCFLMTRDKYFELGVCDETWGFWGSQGIEVAAKTWLSGGRVVCNHRTSYSHLFRTQGGDFGFPYDLSGATPAHAKNVARETFFTNSWPQQTRPLSWLVEKFWPVPGWTDADLARIKESKLASKSAGMVYYTDSRLDYDLAYACRTQLARSVNGHALTSVSLEPLAFGNNIVIDRERGIITMFEQILAGIEATDADYIFLTEHDLLYHPTHFEFVPVLDNTYYYNENTWKVDRATGKAIFYICRQTSGLCASRDLLLTHYRKRLDMVRRSGFSRRMGFEPGTHGRRERVDDYRSEGWMSEYPNIDIRHGGNLTPSRWRQDQFRDQRNCRGWKEADEIPGWGRTAGRMDEFIAEVTHGIL